MKQIRKLSTLVAGGLAGILSLVGCDPDAKVVVQPQKPTFGYFRNASDAGEHVVIQSTDPASEDSLVAVRTSDGLARLLAERTSEVYPNLSAVKGNIAIVQPYNSVRGESDAEVFDLATGQKLFDTNTPNEDENFGVIEGNRAFFTVWPNVGAGQNVRFYDMATNQWVDALPNEPHSFILSRGQSGRDTLVESFDANWNNPKVFSVNKQTGVLELLADLAGQNVRSVSSDSSKDVLAFSTWNNEVVFQSMNGRVTFQGAPGTYPWVSNISSDKTEAIIYVNDAGVDEYYLANTQDSLIPPTLIDTSSVPGFSPLGAFAIGRDRVAIQGRSNGVGQVLFYDRMTGTLDDLLNVPGQDTWFYGAEYGGKMLIGTYANFEETLSYFNGTNVTQVARGNDTLLHTDPTGRYAAIKNQEADGTYTLSVLDMQTGSVTSIANSRWITNAQVSPDGTKIAYVAEVLTPQGFAREQVNVAPTQGGASVLLSESSTAYVRGWTRDNSRVVFVQHRNNELTVGNVATQELNVVSYE